MPRAQFSESVHCPGDIVLDVEDGVPDRSLFVTVLVVLGFWFVLTGSQIPARADAITDGFDISAMLGKTAPQLRKMMRGYSGYKSFVNTLIRRIGQAGCTLNGCIIIEIALFTSIASTQHTRFGPLRKLSADRNTALSSMKGK